MTSKTLKIACAAIVITAGLAGLAYASRTITTLSDGLFGSPQITRLTMPPSKPVEAPAVLSITSSGTGAQTGQPKGASVRTPAGEKVSPARPPSPKPARTLAVAPPDQADDAVNLPSGRPPSQGRIAVVEGGVQLRKSPGIEAPRIEILKSGSELEVIKSDGRWLYVTTQDGKTGYVHGRLVVNGKPSQ